MQSHKVLKFWDPKFFLGVLTCFLVIILLIFNKPLLTGDGIRYMEFAENLLNGYFANSDMKPGFLWNGPGYPMIISIFKFFNSPLLVFKILNIIFIILGSYFLYLISIFFLPKKISLIISFTSGFTHPFIIDAISRILTESLTYLLINLFVYLFVLYSKNLSNKKLFFLSIIGGLLILTKVFFAYVFLVLLTMSIALFTFKKVKFNLVLISFFPFIICLPYLIYTFNLTGKIFYWADSGGSVLYSMSTPYIEEYGDWFSPYINAKFNDVNYTRNSSRTTNTKSNPPYFQKHYPFLKSISSLNGVEKDSALKRKAIQNIISNPKKILKNIVFNYSRIFFRTPFTDRKLKDEFKWFFYGHGLITILGLFFSLFVLFTRTNNFQITAIFIFFLTYLISTSILSADTRYFFPIYGIFTFLVLKQINYYFLESK